MHYRIIFLDADKLYSIPAVKFAPGIHLPFPKRCPDIPTVFFNAICFSQTLTEIDYVV